VKVNFERNGFSLKINGKDTDYGLKRRAGPRGSMRGDLLPVGFELCPERCSLVVVPGKKIELMLRPEPKKYLPAGTRVHLRGLREAELNGRCGTVLEYLPSTGQEMPSRYSVQLDDGSKKRVLRKHLKAQDEACDAEEGEERLTVQEDSIKKVKETKFLDEDVNQNVDETQTLERAKEEAKKIEEIDTFDKVQEMMEKVEETKKENEMAEKVEEAERVEDTDVPAVSLMQDAKEMTPLEFSGWWREAGFEDGRLALLASLSQSRGESA